MSQFTPLDLEILEEILYSSLTISLKNLAASLDQREEKVEETLKKLESADLLTLKGDLISVDKEMRKYYEFQILKFEEGFQPGLEFFFALLRTVPIQLLPNWYSIPRTSNNIFDSLIEKYFLTPQLFQRYLIDLTVPDPIYHKIIEDLFREPALELSAPFLIHKYKLSRAAFDEILLYLEFSFVCCLCYKKVGSQFEEVVTPFCEWKNYLLFLKTTAPKPILEEERIVKNSPAKAQTLSEVQQALHLFRFESIASFSERAVREAEKTITRAAYLGWVFFEDFFKGMTAVLHDDQLIALKRSGKSWKYALPSYSEEEKQFIKSIIFDHLAPLGLTATGAYAGKDCFCVTPLGQKLFGNHA
jgi:predicted transcriptional regulator